MIIKTIAAVVLLTTTAAAQCQNGQCQLQPAGYAPTPGYVVTQPVAQAAPRYLPAYAQASPGYLPREINRDPVAYAHAAREVRILAAQGYRNGHPLGCAPGCRASGTGYSHSPNRPTHCLMERGDGPIVARACYRCPRTGRYYWSAHYRR